MRLATLFVSTLILLSNTSISKAETVIKNNIKAESNSGNGGDSNIKINVDNTLGTNSNLNSEGGGVETNIDIHQEGEGTSEVTINGKTWKQEGPGDVSVRENSSNSDTEDDEETSPTNKEEKYEQEVLSAETEKQSVVRKILNFFRNFFSKIFGG